jgi:hypothetical protein
VLSRLHCWRRRPLDATATNTRYDKFTALDREILDLPSRTCGRIISLDKGILWIEQP